MRTLPAEELERLHGLYSTGQLSLKTLAEKFAEYGMTETKIRSLAAKHKWDRELAKTTRAEGRSKAARRAAAEHLEAKTLEEHDPDRLTAEQVVLAGAEIQASILEKHQKFLARLNSHKEALFEELEEMRLGGGELRKAMSDALFGLNRNDPSLAKVLFDMSTSLSTHERTKTYKLLVEANARVLDTELKVYNMTNSEGRTGTLEEYLEQLEQQDNE